MRTLLVVMPALLLAGPAAAQSEGRKAVLDPRAKVPPVEFRSAFEGYRPYAGADLHDWRKSNEEAGAVGGHQGPKPQPGKPEGSGQPAGKSEGAPPRQGHGGHK